MKRTLLARAKAYTGVKRPKSEIKPGELELALAYCRGEISLKQYWAGLARPRGYNSSATHRIGSVIRQSIASGELRVQIVSRKKTAMKRLTQQERIYAVLQSLQSGDHNIPDEFLRRHASGDGISARYFKQVLLVSECNGRISELRSKGYDIETSRQKDAFGFAYHRLKGAGVALSPIARAAEMCRLFDLGRPAEEIFAA